jgi:hypothetical protein
MSSYECGVCGWAGRMPWGRECPQCHPKTDQQITFQVLAGRRDEEAIAAAKRYVRGLEAQVQRVREECEYPWFFDVGEHAGETPQGLPFVETAAVLKALDGGDE